MNPPKLHLKKFLAIPVIVLPLTLGFGGVALAANPTNPPPPLPPDQIAAPAAPLPAAGDDASSPASADADSVRRDDEESMLAEAGRTEPSEPRRDPEEAALELLQNELGARRIDNG